MEPALRPVGEGGEAGSRNNENKTNTKNNNRTAWVVPPDLKRQRNCLPISAVISPESRGSRVWENRNAAEGGTASRFSAVEAGELPSRHYPGLFLRPLAQQILKCDPPQIRY